MNKDSITSERNCNKRAPSTATCYELNGCFHAIKFFNCFLVLTGLLNETQIERRISQKELQSPFHHPLYGRRLDPS
ncbi:hypothetical protein KFK09_019988 [Dendrobium nobile]|uniref:Uncharacterized protein n=1 Tax=Dendrobium nobile TaxID=94219 RepID=A0A8T3ASJ9_DENNO|nr:hypothetical protein KFK09_019988 [Dendrobium nobile]